MSISTRRRFLVSLGLGAVTPLVGCDSDKPQKGFLGKMEGVNRDLQSTLFHGGSHAAREHDSSLTPEDKFPIYKIGNVLPPVPADYRLRLGGLVDRPQLLTLDDVKGMTPIDLRLQHHCVEGWSAIADWHGVRVRDLAERAGASKQAKFVEFVSFEIDPDAMPMAGKQTYWSSWDRDSALHRQTMLAYGMNGHDLGVEHGAPLRLYSSTKLGYKNVKWISEVNFLDENTSGYWERIGYEWYAGT